MRRIVIQCGREETKIALMEHNTVVEYFVEQSVRKQGIGCIYKGRIMNVLPGMQAAFVDIGAGKNAFLYIDDVLPANLEKHPAVKPTISELLTEGRDIIVQVTKEPMGTKGARVTTHLSIPGRWLVYMPYADYVGVSRKIATDEERLRWKQFGETHRKAGEGLIIRTVASGESEESLAHDLQFLRDLWSRINDNHSNQKAPCEVYHDLDMILKVVRDFFTDQIDQFVIDNVTEAEKVIAFLRDISPELIDRVVVYDEPIPIFSQYGIDEQLEINFRRKIWMPNGANLVVDQTEALTVIDVNTGKFTGTTDLEQTVFETNMEAAKQIPAILRLRDIGGIIIIDFIAMDAEEHRIAISQLLETILRQDRARTHIFGWTKLGLLEMTRKKIRSQPEPEETKSQH